MFKQLTIAEFRQVRFRLRSVSEFVKFSRNPATSSRCRRIPGIPCQIPARLAGEAGSPAISPDLQLSGRDTGRIGRISSCLAGEAGSGQNAGSPAIWPDPRHLAGSGCSGRISGQLARTAGFRSTGRDPAVLCRIPAKIAGILRKWPDSGNFAGICICQI
jgi:hypothetical protein